MNDLVKHIRSTFLVLMATCLVLVGFALKSSKRDVILASADEQKIRSLFADPKLLHEKIISSLDTKASQQIRGGLGAGRYEVRCDKCKGYQLLADHLWFDSSQQPGEIVIPPVTTLGEFKTLWEREDQISFIPGLPQNQYIASAFNVQPTAWIGDADFSLKPIESDSSRDTCTIELPEEPVMQEKPGAPIVVCKTGGGNEIGIFLPTTSHAFIQKVYLSDVTTMGTDLAGRSSAKVQSFEASFPELAKEAQSLMSIPIGTLDDELRRRTTEAEPSSNVFGVKLESTIVLPIGCMALVAVELYFWANIVELGRIGKSKDIPPGFIGFSTQIWIKRVFGSLLTGCPLVSLLTLIFSERSVSDETLLGITALCSVFVTTRTMQLLNKIEALEG